MLGRHHGVGHAEAGVGPRGEDAQAQLFVALDGEVEFGTFGTADPVALHGLDPLGPVESVQRFQELVGVGGDAEEPLLEVTLGDEVARPIARSVGQDLFVGQHGLAAGAPVDRGQSAVGQARLPELQEDELGPVDVGGVVTMDLPAQVVDRAQAQQRGLELGDAGIGEGPGVGPRLDGRVLRRQAERVEADRAEHALAQHGLVAHGQVAECVIADMPLMGRPRGIGVHAQGVELFTRIVVVDAVGTFVLPVALPLLFNADNIECAGHATRVGEATGVPERARGRGGEVWRRPARLLACPLATGGVAQLVERLTGSQEVRGFKSHRLHPESAGRGIAATKAGSPD